MSSKCPVCERELGTVNIDAHHLVPKTFGGKVTEPLHKICHRKLHSVFTEREMLHVYNNWETIRNDPEIIKFIKWVHKKPVDFYDGSKETTERKRKRR